MRSWPEVKPRARRLTDYATQLYFYLCNYIHKGSPKTFWLCLEWDFPLKLYRWLWGVVTLGDHWFQSYPLISWQKYGNMWSTRVDMKNYNKGLSCQTSVPYTFSPEWPQKRRGLLEYLSKNIRNGIIQVTVIYGTCISLPLQGLMPIKVKEETEAMASLS